MLATWYLSLTISAVDGAARGYRAVRDGVSGIFLQRWGYLVMRFKARLAALLCAIGICAIIPYRPHWLDRSYVAIVAIVSLLVGLALHRLLRRKLSAAL